MFGNVGPIERLVRFGLAGAAMVPVLSGRQSPRFRNWAGVAAAAELFTVTTRFCPVNTVLGIDNCKRRGVVRTLAPWLVAGAGVAYLFDPHAGAGRWAGLRSRLSGGTGGQARQALSADARGSAVPGEGQLHVV